MADKTILQLTDIGALQDGDQIPVGRVGKAEDNSTTPLAIKNYLGSVSYIQQTLTNEQKAQARENIGAGKYAAVITNEEMDAVLG